MVGAIDIGGTKIAVGVVNSDGQVLTRLECPTRGDGPYEDALDRITRMLREAVAKVSGEIQGIGIGSTGPLDALSGEFQNVNFFPGWCGENLVEDLTKIFGLSVAIENDGDAAALGEAGWGAGRNKSRVVYVTIGTGIGVGVIINGQPYRGVNGAHPEIGHHLIDPSGPQCDCGFRGCWESLAAGPAMVTWMRNNAPVNYPNRDKLTGKSICELALAGDECAKRAVQHEAQHLSLGLANLVTMFAPEVMILGGSVMKSADLFMDEIRKTIANCCRLVPHEKTELALASLGEDTNLIGAARVWYYRCGPNGGKSAH